MDVFNKSDEEYGEDGGEQEIEQGASGEEGRKESIIPRSLAHCSLLTHSPLTLSLRHLQNPFRNCILNGNDRQSISAS